MGSDPPKKVQIREYWRENPDSTGPEVAEVFDTADSYARLHKPDDLKSTTSGAKVDHVQAPEAGNDDLADVVGDHEPSDLDDPALAAEVEQTKAEGGDPDSDDPFEGLREFVIEDEHDEYECGDCSAPVEYLDPKCTECGEPLNWFAEGS